MTLRIKVSNGSLKHGILTGQVPTYLPTPFTPCKHNDVPFWMSPFLPMTYLLKIIGRYIIGTQIFSTGLTRTQIHKEILA